MSDFWLIRTAENKIFGPVKAEKILDLIQKGSLKNSDEVSSGNGHWIFIRETELIDTYLKERKTQPFNPISEAEYVQVPSYEMDFVEQVSAAKFPEEKDLEYPSMGPGSTMAKNEQPATKDEISLENSSMPSDSDLEYPDLTAESAPVPPPAAAKPAPKKGPVSVADLDDGEDIQEIVFELEEKAATEENKQDAAKPSGNVLPSDDDLDYPE